MEVYDINIMTKEEKIIEVDCIPPILEIPLDTKEDLQQQITELREKADQIEEKLNNIEGEI